MLVLVSLPVVLVHVSLSSLRMWVVILAPSARFPAIQQKTEISAHSNLSGKKNLQKNRGVHMQAVKNAVRVSEHLQASVEGRWGVSPPLENVHVLAFTIITISQLRPALDHCPRISVHVAVCPAGEKIGGFSC